MTQMIDPVSRSIPGIFIINTMTAEAKRGDMLKHFNVDVVSGKKVMVKVEMKINDVEVDFCKSLTEMWNRLQESYDADVLAKAKELVSNSRFEKLNQLLADAEYKIEDELNSLMIKLENTQ